VGHLTDGSRGSLVIKCDPLSAVKQQSHATFLIEIRHPTVEQPCHHITLHLFQSCASIVDVCSRLMQKEIMWQERQSRTSELSCKIEFSGMPFIVLGRQSMQCCYGNRTISKSARTQQSVCVTASALTVLLRIHGKPVFLFR